MRRALARWCGREDSNFHGVSPTATSTLRVYRFRHDRLFPCDNGCSCRFLNRDIANAAWAIKQPPGRERHETVIERSVEWLRSPDPLPYPETVAAMEARVAAIREGREAEAVWLLEHPPIYTAGTSARSSDLLEGGRFPVYRTGRGGQYTYHGPGQRVAYAMMDLKPRRGDIRAYVRNLEAWVIASLGTLGVQAARREGRVGIWVPRGPGRDDKIAAIGVRVRRWVTYHGISVNHCPNLSHYAGIVPCGIRDHGVTSLADLGNGASMDDLDNALREAFETVFGVATQDAASPFPTASAAA